ncbi:MAG TPA: hypothetical protein VFE60_04735 [Roseiarcus sp.]|nr:hypothetical protein [Roseiarcus sp.]
MQNDAPSPIRLVVDNTRKRRQVAVPQAAISRAIRAAAAAGPHWRVSIDGDVIHLFQGDAPAALATPVAPDKRWRL